MIDKLKNTFPVLLIIVFVGLHIPFLNADPDVLIDPWMRHAWTDEGLYTSQIRNFIHHGKLDIAENSTFVRGPLFNIIQLPFFAVFGTSLMVGRLITLLLVSLMLYLFLKKENLRILGVMILLLCLLEYRTFQFTHYCMSEMMVVSFVMLSLYFIVLTKEISLFRKKLWFVFLSTFFLFAAYSVKIQYLYIGALTPAVLFLLAVNDSLRERKLQAKFFSIFFFSVVFSAFFVFLYFFLWFLPNKDFYLYVMQNETSGRFGHNIQQFWEILKFNIENVVWNDGNRLLYFNFLVLLVVAVFFFLFKKTKAQNPEIILFALIWIILELHKLMMTYLPNQYLISMVFAVGLFSASMYYELYKYFFNIRYLFFVVPVVIGVVNMQKNYEAFKRRTYTVEYINNYLAQFSLKDKTIIGPWAATMTWKTDSKTLPVWDKYFNWQNPVKTFKPAIVISEDDERDSDFCYKNQGINLKEFSDSVRVFRVYDYNLMFYWIKQ